MREAASKGAAFHLKSWLPTCTMCNMTYSINMRRGVLIAILALTAIFAVATSSAHANIAPSATLAASGHPASYTDAAGVSLALCVADPGCPSSPAVLDNGDDASAEAFYQLATSTVSAPGGGSVTVDFNVEAAFLSDAGSGDPLDPVAFTRIQFSASGLEPNSTYTVVHPYGESKFKTNATGGLASGDRSAQREEFPAAPQPGVFDNPMQTNVDTFLVSTNAPAGYTGGSGTIQPTAHGNTLTVTGPGLPAEQRDPVSGAVIRPAGITTAQFTIEGKLDNGTVPTPPADTDGDGIIDLRDACVNVAGPASNQGCPLAPTPPVVQPVQPQPQVVTRTVNNTVTQIIPAPTLGSPTVVNRQASFNGRVTGISIRKGVLRARSPRGADLVRLTVRKGGKFVKRITVNVNDNGQRFTRTLTRKAGSYSVTIQAGNEQRDVLTFGPSVRRSFRVV